MRYDEVITDIARQAGDPTGDRLSERSKDHFDRAVSELILAGEYTESDLPGFFKLNKAIDFGDTGNVEDISALNVLRIDDVFLNPGLAGTSDLYGQSVMLVSTRSVKNLARNTNLAPADTEFFVWRVGDTLHPVVSSGNAATIPLPAGDELYMTYVEYPDSSAWDDTQGTGTELTGLFSDPFIHRAVGRAASTLLEEDTL